MNKPKPYHHGDLRQALLKAALGLVREPGGSELPCAKLLAALVCRIQHRIVTFEMADLLAAVAQDGFERLTATIKSAATKAQPPFEQLQNAGIAYVEIAQTQPEHFSVTFTIDLRKGHASRKRLRTSASPN